ncbi:MAG: hypothetical protein IPK50_01860 [Fibrobacterota bacterium]|nr:MAG: hypothetical protein IPK50_01860 [Fibrobacterota bacterium]
MSPSAKKAEPAPGSNDVTALSRPDSATPDTLRLLATDTLSQALPPAHAMLATRPPQDPSSATRGTIGLRIAPEQWIGIQAGIRPSWSSGYFFAGLSGKVDNAETRKDSSITPSSEGRVTWIHLSTQSTVEASGIRSRIGYEQRVQTPTPLIFTVSGAFEASWTSTISSLEVASDTTLNSFWSVKTTSRNVKQYPSIETSTSEYGPRVGLGLRCPALGSALSVVAQLESGASWSVTETDNDSLRTAGWKSTPLQWTLGFDWTF